MQNYKILYTTQWFASSLTMKLLHIVCMHGCVYLANLVNCYLYFLLIINISEGFYSSIVNALFGNGIEPLFVPSATVR